MNIRRAEHSRAVHVSYSKPEGALAQTLMTYRQTHTAIAVAELNKKQKRFY